MNLAPRTHFRAHFGTHFRSHLRTHIVRWWVRFSNQVESTGEQNCVCLPIRHTIWYSGIFLSIIDNKNIQWTWIRMDSNGLEYRMERVCSKLSLWKPWSARGKCSFRAVFVCNRSVAYYWESQLWTPIHWTPMWSSGHSRSDIFSVAIFVWLAIFADSKITVMILSAQQAYLVIER